MSYKNGNLHENDILESAYEMGTEDSDRLQIGDLFAYIEGDASPEVVERIESSTKYRQQADEMKRMSENATDLFTDARVVDRLDLVDVASGQATANQRLIVAAHCRRDPAIAAEFEDMKEYWQEMRGTEVESEGGASWITNLLPDFTARRLLTNANTRSSEVST